MAPSSPPLDRRGFEIAIICALPLEANCVQAAFDKTWPKCGKAAKDPNAYTTGVIGDHNVVLVHMPSIAKVSAASVATGLRMSFTGIKLALVVGICGGIPYDAGSKKEILLGDVIISEGLDQYDLGRQYPGSFKTKHTVEDSLSRPSQEIRAVLQQFKTNHYRQAMQKNITEHLTPLQQKLPEAKYPGSDQDKLYEPSYIHKHHEATSSCAQCAKGEKEICDNAVATHCDKVGCAESRLVRSRLATPLGQKPLVHFGKMGSADTVMNSAEDRDRIADSAQIIAFEMEGADVWDQLPCIVIKGVCDYADSHKMKRWQNYAAATAAACMKAFLMAWTSGDKDEEPKWVTYSVIPRQLLKGFIGREDELRRISSLFSSGETEDPQVLILQAIGGQGKSQIALKYCQQSTKIYRGIFWANASSETSVTASFVTFAQELDHDVATALKDDQERVKFVLRTLKEWDARWLLVFDNYDDPEQDNQRFIPPGRSDVLITTRHRSIERLGTVIEIPPMQPAEAVKILLRGFRGINIDQYTPEASKIATRLGHLALALDQAAAYMQYIQLPIQNLSEFLVTYETQRKKILRHTPKHFWEYGAMRAVEEADQSQTINAFTTWEMSFRQLYKNDPKRQEDAEHFLTISAFLGPTKISESLFILYWAFHNPRWMHIFTASDDTDSDSGDSSISAEPHETIADSFTSAEDNPQPRTVETPRLNWDRDRFWDLLSETHTLALLQDIRRTDQEGSIFNLHPLIRDWMQLRIGLKRRQMYSREGMDVLVSSITLCEHIQTPAALKHSLLLHLDTCLQNDGQLFNEGHSLGQEVASCKTASEISSFYQSQGRFADSGKLAAAVLRTRMEAAGREHPSTLGSMNSLALAFMGQGRWKEAEELNIQVMETMKRVLGMEHPDTLTSMANLASTFRDQGRWKEAEDLEVQVMETMKRVLGMEHPDTLTSMADLASTILNQGRWKEAEDLGVQVMETMKRVLGVEHPSTLISMENLASTFGNQGRSKEAEDLEVQVMETRKRVLGMEHPDTLTSMANLASAFRNQGRWKEAEDLEVQVMETMKRVLGMEHPDTLTSVTNLASTFRDQGRWKEAEDLGVQAMETRKRVLGMEHPSTLTSMGNLASTFMNQGRWKEAEDLGVQVMETMKRVLGMEHPFTLTSMNNLAVTLGNGAEYERARELLVEVLQISCRVLGPEHPQTRDGFESLWGILVQQCGEESALKVFKDLLEEMVLGLNLSAENSEPAVNKDKVTASEVEK